MKIQYLSHKEINKSKWDQTIAEAGNGNIYAYSWYLDIVCPDWQALIAYDYSVIMPLTGNKKFGFNYLFRPMLSQQLGVFSKKQTSNIDIDSFLKAVPSKFRLIQYCFNKTNIIPEQFEPKVHNTFELILSKNYETIRSNYSENHRRNLKKAAKNGNKIYSDLPKEEFIELLQNDSSAGSEILKMSKNLYRLNLLIDKLKEHNALNIIGLKNSDNRLISAVLFAFSHKSWYYLAPVGSPEGKSQGGLFSIIDFLIQDQAEKDAILDFEGSDIPGLAKFYSGFGAHPVNYHELNTNSLPWPIKYLK